MIWDKVKDIESVVEFFDTYNKIKPHFLFKTVTHPLTGLSGTTISLPDIACVYSASMDDYRERWGYRIENTIDLRSKTERSFYVVRDISELLDPSRDDQSKKEFSQSETRRLARLFRLYLESKKLKRGEFLLAFDKPKAFWDATLPKATFIELPIDDLRGNVPRAAPPKGSKTVYVPPIRGLALAKRAGEQKAVTEVAFAPETAWVSSDQYRRRPEDTFVVASKFGIKQVYIASPTALKHVEDAKIPSLKDAIAGKLADEHKVSLDDIVNLAGKLSSSSTGMSFFGRAIEQCEADFDALGRMKSGLASYFVAMKPFLVAKVHGWNERERTYIRSLYDVDGNFQAPPKSAACVAFEEGYNLLFKSYNHPIRKFVENLSNANSKEQVEACTKALAGLLRAIPLTMTFGH
uniref:Uncharacterized protein n=1 Tax=Caulobacter phage BL57 TaxID=3348355 RepID=A0AB74UMF9_9VIRU